MSREPTLYVYDYNRSEVPEERFVPASRADLLAGLGLLCPNNCNNGVSGGCKQRGHREDCHGIHTLSTCHVCGGHGYNPDKVEWLCYYPEFNDEGCLVRHRADRTRQPRKHQACGWVVPLGELRKEPE